MLGDFAKLFQKTISILVLNVSVKANKSTLLRLYNNRDSVDKARLEQIAQQSL